MGADRSKDPTLSAAVEPSAPTDPAPACGSPVCTSCALAAERARVQAWGLQAVSTCVVCGDPARLAIPEGPARTMARARAPEEFRAPWDPAPGTRVQSSGPTGRPIYGTLLRYGTGERAGWALVSEEEHPEIDVWWLVGAMAASETPSASSTERPPVSTGRSEPPPVVPPMGDGAAGGGRRPLAGYNQPATEGVHVTPSEAPPGGVAPAESSGGSPAERHEGETSTSNAPPEGAPVPCDTWATDTGGCVWGCRDRCGAPECEAPARPRVATGARRERAAKLHTLGELLCDLARATANDRPDTGRPDRAMYLGLLLEDPRVQRSLEQVLAAATLGMVQRNRELKQASGEAFAVWLVDDLLGLAAGGEE